MRTGNLLLVLCLSWLVVSGCSKHPTVQSKALDDRTKVILEDAWILGHTPNLLDVVFVYEGVDPNIAYKLTARLRAEEHGQEFWGGWLKQIPIPSPGATNQVRTMWEFGAFPPNSRNIYLRMDYTEKESGLSRSVDFKLPGARQLPVRKMGSQ